MYTMPTCNDCNKASRDVSWCLSDLWLCKACDNTREAALRQKNNMKKQPTHVDLPPASVAGSNARPNATSSNATSNATVNKNATTDDSLVRNEVLAFVTQKLNYMPPDTIVQLCTSFYSEDELCDASSKLFSLCADENDPTQRYRKRKGENKKKTTMEDIISLVQKKNNMLNVTFCAVDLMKLPPISFNNLDVSLLLAQIEANKVEMELMKRSVSTMNDAVTAQSAVCEDLVTSVKTLMERDSVESQTRKAVNDNDNDDTPAIGDKMVSSAISTNSSKGIPAPRIDDSSVKESSEVEELSNEEGEMSISDEEMAALYSQVVRKKPRFSPVPNVRNVTLKSQTGRVPQPTLLANKNTRPGKSGIIGKGVNTGIRAIKKKSRYANVFATRFHPGVNEVKVKDFLDSRLKLETSVTCVKVTEWYSSFHITCACEDPSVFMDDSLWPEGVFVRWWGEKRHKQSRHSDVIPAGNPEDA
jgi:hypothetical protein